MSYSKQFSVKNLRENQPFVKSLEPVLALRLKQIQKRFERYKNAHSSENLHKLRIAFRRFRYTLELYCNCIKPKAFKKIYEKATQLQELTGFRRDLDVMRLKLEELYAKSEFQIPFEVLSSIEAEQKRFEDQILVALDDFFSDPPLRKIVKLD